MPPAYPSGCSTIRLSGPRGTKVRVGELILAFFQGAGEAIDFGRVHEAIDAFKIALWSAETVEAHVALGEAYRQAKDVAAARVEAERALALDPASADAKQLLARLEGR